MFKRAWWLIPVMIPVGAFAGLLVAAVVTYLIPKTYVSECVIEVKPQRHLAESAKGNVPVSSNFLSTEFEKIKSRASLGEVVKRLELGIRWNVDEETARQILKGMISSRNIKGTDLISITARSTSKVDARDIAHEVAKVYADYRSDITTRDAERYLVELRKAVRDQEDKVEERRKVLATIVRAKGIIQSGPDYADAKREFEADQQLLQTLKLKQIGEEISLKIPSDSVVIHDEPVLSHVPASPNVILNLIIGGAAGTLLGAFVALPLMWIFGSRQAVGTES